MKDGACENMFLQESVQMHRYFHQLFEMVKYKRHHYRHQFFPHTRNPRGTRFNIRNRYTWPSPECDREPQDLVRELPCSTSTLIR